MTNLDVPLPLDVKNRIFCGSQYSLGERKETFDKFMQKFFKLTSEDPENFNQYMVHLSKTPSKKPVKLTAHNSKKLTLSKRRELGLYTLGKKTLKYKNLLSLHDLWKEYMSNYIDLDCLRKQNWPDEYDDPNFGQISLKLYRADYHGAKFCVIKSTCSNFVGINGIVVMETKNCFKLLGQDNIIRTVSKASCVFKFKLEEFEFSFYGKNFQIRPAERSSKKIKTIYSSDF